MGVTYPIGGANQARGAALLTRCEGGQGECFDRLLTAVLGFHSAIPLFLPTLGRQIVWHSLGQFKIHWQTFFLAFQQPTEVD